MFYNIFLILCQKAGKKPTPVLKELHLSPGNLDKWKNGATVNSDVLLKISEHFGVSIDYLLTGKENEKKLVSGLTENEQKILKYYEKLTEEQQDYIKGEMARMNMENKQDTGSSNAKAT